ncbi:hypothetical protein [Bradyrhizobium sp. sGM-13]|uniref:hypothetical protein n=1 Tax=Bradyrhizobium sp. sGM-13 TaxID=2831781 RepID=UPI001BCED98A|nr:hypothetical protein [Bradyrhizobium sp. sGM-13]
MLAISGTKPTKENAAKKGVEAAVKISIGFAAAVMKSAASAERSSLSEMETVRSEPPGNGARLAFACFQGNLLG